MLTEITMVNARGKLRMVLIHVIINKQCHDSVNEILTVRIQLSLRL